MTNPVFCAAASMALDPGIGYLWQPLVALIKGYTSIASKGKWSADTGRVSLPSSPLFLRLVSSRVGVKLERRVYRCVVLT